MMKVKSNTSSVTLGSHPVTAGSLYRQGSTEEHEEKPDARPYHLTPYQAWSTSTSAQRDRSQRGP